MPKKENIPDLSNLTEEEKLKLEIAEEIGVFDKVMSTGWRSLSAKESGRIGGLLARRRKAEKVETQ
ncbi:MAG: small, acid-soluble spore protein, alpha/beta type [Lachnospiraceae bacterium]|nr:small, acid-soluble spore protein, alpha/beta type [Lachnospiraceae bacterium]